MRRERGSEVETCLECHRNEKVLITTLIAACQAVVTGLDRREGGREVMNGSD